MAEGLKFRADEVTRLRVFRIALFYESASDLMENSTLIRVQEEETRMGVPTKSGKVKPASRRYDTYDDLPPDRKESYDEYTRLLEVHHRGGFVAESLKGEKKPAVIKLRRPKS